MTQECAKASAFVNEDHGDYCNAWEEQNELTENLVWSKKVGRWAPISSNFPQLYIQPTSLSHIFCLFVFSVFLQPSCQKPEFKYTTAADLDSLPYTAKLDIYGGGGYVYRYRNLVYLISRKTLHFLLLVSTVFLG